MSSNRGTNNGGAGVQSIPPAARKIVQSLKEIVNRPELEIYATLKDCHMDPDEAVNRLLSQGLSLSLSPPYVMFFMCMYRFLLGSFGF